MIAAKIENSKVVNLILVASLSEAPGCIDGSGAAIGDTWDGSKFIKPQPDLSVLRLQIIADIRAERDRRKFNGVLVAGKWIHTDTYSRTQWMGMKIMGASVTEVDWVTMDGSTIKTTPVLAAAVFDAVAALDTSLFNYARNLISQIDTSANPASINIKTGWPVTFGE